MRFDVVVGNPPYQEDNSNNNRSTPIYQNFYDLAEKCSFTYCLISPARFLFNAGQTPKEWNKKILNDKHVKVVYYNPEASKVFPDTGFKGGVSVLYRDEDKDFGAIKTFVSLPELDNIMRKVINSNGFVELGEIIYVRSSYKLMSKLFEDHPKLKGRAKQSEALSMGSNIFDRYPEVFSDHKKNDQQVQIFGRENNERVYKYIDADYVKDGGNLNGWKVFLPKTNGGGKVGEVLSTPVVAPPKTGHTQTFISFGKFETRVEAEALLKYLKSKFLRLLLSIKKITQDNATKETWSKIPLQDFTPSSDIDWTASISDIDKQLYLKYNLDVTDISFIENNVKTMS